MFTMCLQDCYWADVHVHETLFRWLGRALFLFSLSSECSKQEIRMQMKIDKGNTT